MNTASVFIKLLPFNEYNFYVDLYSDRPTEATNGLKLLEEELSSELAFYIPETYHKKVIGAGGSTIQSIMRKYNVFIKFSSGFDCNPNGFTHIRSDNVLIRCPSKNAKEILPAKKELQDTVFDRSQEHGNTFVRLSRSHMRILLTQQNDFVFDVENKTNTIIILPNEELFENPENLLEIKGVMGTSDAAARLIKAMLPEDYEFKVAASQKFDSLVSEDNVEFFEKVVVPFRVALKIEVQVFSKPEHPEEEAPYHQIVLSFSQEHSVGLEDAIQILTAYLRDKDLDIIDRGEFHVDPIVQGTAAALTHGGTKRRVKNDFRSRDLDANFNPPTRPRNHEPNRLRSQPRPPTEPSRITNPYERPAPHTPSRQYREPDSRQSSHPYRKPLSQPKRTFRQSPQSNRFKYQHNDFDYRQQPQYYEQPSQHYQENQYPPQQPTYPPPQQHYHPPAYEYPPRSPPPPLSPSRHYNASYPHGYHRDSAPPSRNGYHRSTASAGSDYRPAQPPNGYYDGPRYEELRPAPPGGAGRPYREEYRDYHQSSGYAPSQPPPPPPPGPVSHSQGGRPYNDGYDRGNIRPRYY